MNDGWFWITCFLTLSVLGLFIYGLYLLVPSTPPSSPCPNNILLALTEFTDRSIIYLEGDRVVTIDPSVVVVSACNYSSWTLYLTTSNEIYIYDEANSTHFVKSNSRTLSAILSLGDDLYGVSEGRLYRMTSNPNTYHWVWEGVDWCVPNIRFVSTTMTDSHLYVWDGSMGRIYSMSGASGDTGPIKRAYGRDVDWYVEFENGKSTVHPTGNHYQSPFGLIDYYGNFHAGEEGTLVTINYMVYRL